MPLFCQVFGIADAGQHQDLRRVDRAARQDDVASGRDGLTDGRPDRGRSRRDRALSFQVRSWSTSALVTIVRFGRFRIGFR